MAPGSWNGKNFGGLHTGTGKYQKGGVYSSNGKRFKPFPNSKFEVGKEVAYIGSHKDYRGEMGKGVVVSKNGDTIRSGRSIIKVKLGNQNVYFHKNNLRFI